MTIGLIFWVLMLMWLVLGIWANWPFGDAKSLGGLGLSFVLFLILGWQAFGSPARL